MLKKLATATIVLAFLASGAAFASVQSMGTVVTLHKTSLGKVLATSRGRTLYLYTPDGPNQSTCTGSCAATWPPLKTGGKPVASTGVKRSLLGTAKLSSGKLQVTYNGHPLYRYVGDLKPAQTNGEGVDGVWFVVNAGGIQAATRK